MTRGGRADVEKSDSQGQITTKDCSTRYCRRVWAGLLRWQRWWLCPLSPHKCIILSSPKLIAEIDYQLAEPSPCVIVLLTERELFCFSLSSEGWVFLPRTPLNRSFSNIRLRVIGKGGWLSQKQKQCLLCRCSCFGQHKNLGGKKLHNFKGFLEINGSKWSSLLFPFLPFLSDFSLSSDPCLSSCMGSNVLLLSIRQVLNPWR